MQRITLWEGPGLIERLNEGECEKKEESKSKRNVPTYSQYSYTDLEVDLEPDISAKLSEGTSSNTLISIISFILITVHFGNIFQVPEHAKKLPMAIIRTACQGLKLIYICISKF